MMLRRLLVELAAGRRIVFHRYNGRQCAMMGHLATHSRY